MNKENLLNTINSNSELTTIFSNEFIEKTKKQPIYIQDLLELTDEQLNHIKKIKHLLFYKTDMFLKYIDLKKSLELYKNAQDYYKLIEKIIIENTSQIIENTYFPIDEFCKKINNSNNIDEIKNIVNNYGQKIISNPTNRYIYIEEYPEEFIEYNKKLFLIGIDIPEEIKQKYYYRELEPKDVLEYVYNFDDVPLDNFIILPGFDDTIVKVMKKLGEGNLQKLIKKHKDVFNYFIMEHPGLLSDLNNFLTTEDNYEKNFEEALKKYYKKDKRRYKEDEKYTIPEWMESMTFEVVSKYYDIEEFKNYNDKTILLDEFQQEAINYLGASNIVKIDEETNYFSHGTIWGERYNFLKDMVYFLAVEHYLSIDTKMEYEEFRKYFAKILESMRLKGEFKSFSPYYWISEGTFRNDFKYLFMDKDAPPTLRRMFNQGKIYLDNLLNKPEYIPFLLDKDLKEIIDNKWDIYYKENNNRKKINLCDYYSERFGKEEFLKLVCKYGNLIYIFPNLEIKEEDTKEIIDKKIRKSIYNRIKKENFLTYEFLNQEQTRDDVFINEYPDIFIDYNSIPNNYTYRRDSVNLYNNFYNRALSFNNLFQKPKLIPFLKDKDLELAFSKLFDGTYEVASKSEGTNKKFKEILKKIGNEEFLKICVDYGNYLKYLKLNELEEICEKDNIIEIRDLIEKYISKACYNGVIKYQETNSPSFLKEKYPDLFLEKNTSDGLYDVFYGNTTTITFFELSIHKHWLKYLKNKAISPIFLRKLGENTSRYQQIKLYFEIFGQDKGYKLGINKPETIDKMIESEQVEKIKTWYESTGEKFIPDYVVMQNFPIDQIDKFLKSSSVWSKLMKIERYSNTEEGRDALLKLAYVFGIFDNDQKGINQLFQLINGVPKTIPYENLYDSNELDNYYRNHMDYLKNRFVRCYNLYIALNEEGFKTDVEKGIMNSIYVTKDNDTKKLYLNIDPQKYPKSSACLREVIESYEDINLLDPKKAHQLFGGFKLIYDKDFKDFLMENIDEILSNPDYTNVIANIQRQFRDIKIANSNRKLTLDLAISYIQQNKYTDIEVGNEEVAEISSIAGYSQSDFDTLQLIYNYGKQRVFSSIPRIKSGQDKYNYEILRLDDPLALAIGTLTDCCQQIGDVAEMCVEHSMVDKNGRVFAIKDNIGNLISQSWVWRNKNVLCFDNIEIPNKVFSRISKENKDIKEFTTEVYNIYKKAAQELIEIDEQKYKELLDEGKITKEQYEGLRLSKVTVGLGYNDIAESINERAKRDRKPSKPLEFDSPIKLDHSLYTSDSETQYIIEETTISIPYNGDTLSLYNDELKIYTKDNFKEKELLKLKKLEIVTKKDPYDLVTDLYKDEGNLISELADNCELEEEKTKIIMNPNFAIIYEEDKNNIKIAEIFYNTKVNDIDKTIDIKDKVLLQLKLALEEITKDKKVDIELLDNNQKEFYKKAMELNDEIYLEKGIKSIKK